MSSIMSVAVRNELHHERRRRRYDGKRRRAPPCATSSTMSVADSAMSSTMSVAERRRAPCAPPRGPNAAERPISCPISSPIAAERLPDLP